MNEKKEQDARAMLENDPEGRLLWTDVYYRVWGYLDKKPYFVAGKWQAAGYDLQDLIDRLDCDDETAMKLGAARAPLPGEDLDEWARDVARALGVSFSSVRDIGRICLEA